MATWEYWDLDLDAPLRIRRGTAAIWNAQPCNLATFTGEIKDRAGDYASPAGHRVRARYAGDDVDFVTEFEGDVVGPLVRTHDGVRSQPFPGIWRFTAQDYTARLGWTVIYDGVRNVTETITERVLWIAGIEPLHGIGTAHVAEIATLIGPDDYTGLTKMQALERVKNEVRALLFVDFEPEPGNVGELHFFLEDDPEANPAPFDLIFPSTPPASHGYTDFDHQEAPEAPGGADEVLVRGHDISVVVVRDGAPDPADRVQRVINAPGVYTNDQARAIGELALLSWSTSRVSGTLRTKYAGLRSGQSVRIVNPTHHLDATFVITSSRPVPLMANTPSSPAEYRLIDGDDFRLIDGDDRRLLRAFKPSSGGYTEWVITYANRFACSTSLEERLGQLEHVGTVPPEDTHTKKVLVLPSYDFDGEAPYSFAWGRYGGFYVHYSGGGGHLFAVRPGLKGLRWQLSGAGDGPIQDHVPDDGNSVVRPVPVGTKFYHTEGRFLFDLQTFVASLGGDWSDRIIYAIASMDQARFWVTLYDPSADTWHLSRVSPDPDFLETVTIDAGWSIRSSPSGQYVAVDLGGDPRVIKIYDRGLDLVQTITLPDVAGGLDWTIDNDFNVYLLDNLGLLSQFEPDRPAAYAWQTDLFDSHTFLASDLAAGYAAPSTLYIDGEMALVAGYVDRGGGLTDGAVLSVNRSTGKVMDEVTKLASSDGTGSAQAVAVVRATSAGPLTVLGWSDADSNDIEGVAFTSLDEWAWLVQIGDLPPGGELTPGDVDDAVDAGVDAHVDDTTDAHDASAISFVPAGTIAATNVQAAIEEVAAEATHDPVTVGTGLDVTGQLVELDLSEVAAGGELGGFMDAPTVDATHSGSTHAATQAAAEATAASALSGHAGAADPHTGYLKESDIDTDGTLAANSDAKVASQKATKTYVDNAVAGAGATFISVAKWGTD